MCHHSVHYESLLDNFLFAAHAIHMPFKHAALDSNTATIRIQGVVHLLSTDLPTVDARAKNCIGHA